MGMTTEVDAVAAALEKEFGAFELVSLRDIVAFVKKFQPKAETEEVKAIFEYWKQQMNSPRSVLDGNRKRLIAKALKDYSPREVCQAIRGCSKSPHHMGDNDQRTKYNGLNLILRNAEYIDKFIALDNGAPRAAKQSVAQQNAAALSFFGGAEDDPMTLEMEK